MHIYKSLNQTNLILQTRFPNRTGVIFIPKPVPPLTTRNKSKFLPNQTVIMFTFTPASLTVTNLDVIHIVSDIHFHLLHDWGGSEFEELEVLNSGSNAPFTPNTPPSHSLSTITIVMLYIWSSN